MTALDHRTGCRFERWSEIHVSGRQNNDENAPCFALSRILGGTCSLDQGSAEVTGKIGDTGIAWQYETEWNGSQLTLVYTGTLDKDSKLSGTVEVQPMSVAGDFTATRSK